MRHVGKEERFRFIGLKCDLLILFGILNKRFKELIGFPCSFMGIKLNIFDHFSIGRKVLVTLLHIFNRFV